MINYQLLILLPVLTAFIILLLSTKTDKFSRLLGIISVFAMFIISYYGYKNLEQPINIVIGGWHPPYGINLFVGKLSSGILIFINFISLLFLINETGKKGYYYILYLIFIMAINGIIMTGDIFNLFVFLEIATITTIGITASTNEKISTAPLIRYFIITTISSMLFLFGIALLYSSTGTLNIADNMIKFKSLNAGFAFTVILLFIPMLLTETEVLPFNFWVPGTYQKSSSNFSAVLSGIFLTAGIYIFIRIFMMFFANSFSGSIDKIKLVLFLITAFSFMSGEIAAFTSKNLKKILAYSSVGQAGLILSGLLVLTNKDAVWGALFLLLSHIIAKSLVFFITGFYVKSQGTSDYTKLIGMGRKYPLLGLGFIIGLLSLTGMPLFAGFWGKFYLLKGLIGSIQGQPKIFYLAGIFLLIGIIVETVYLLRLAHKLFEKPELSDSKVRPSMFLYLTVIVLSGIIIGLGVYPKIINSLINGMVQEIFNVEGYIKVVLG